LILYYDNQESQNTDKFTVKKDLEMRYTDFNQRNGKKEINAADLEDLKIRGINTKARKGIVKYRKKLGYIASISELEIIKGIGPATVRKLDKYFYVDKEKKQTVKKININTENIETLKWLKFTNKEIKKIQEWKRENGSIFCNVELLEILGDKRYNLFTEMIAY